MMGVGWGKATAMAAAVVAVVFVAASVRIARAAEDPSPKFIEVVVIVDNALFQLKGGASTSFAASVIDGVDAIYQSELGIGVHVVQTVVNDTGDPWPLTPNPGDATEVLSDDLLVSVRDWGAANLGTSHDVVILLSGLNFDGTTIGLGFVGSMCSAPATASINEGTGAFDTIVRTVAHETGHNLSMQHDGQPGAGSACSSSGFIMSPNASTGGSMFSSCSLASYNSYVAAGSAICLSDTPKGFCGNGIRETGETCDCGINCSADPCCDTSCQLQAGCACAHSSPCCNSGTIAPSGQSCRLAQSDCDIAEACDGVRESCPADLFSVAGTTCSSGFASNDGACVAGGCESVEKQCRALNLPATGGMCTGSDACCGQLVCDIPPEVVPPGGCYNINDSAGAPIPIGDGIPNGCSSGSQCLAGTCTASSTFDDCPEDNAKLKPGICGCGVVDDDTDSDGTPDCDDECPNDPARIAPGMSGCQVAGGVCGDPVGTALLVGAATRAVNATDALFTLQAAVGSETCQLCVCDVNNSGSIQASDALIVLQSSVGQSVTLVCPAC